MTDKKKERLTSVLDGKNEMERIKEPPFGKPGYVSQIAREIYDDLDGKECSPLVCSGYYALAFDKIQVQTGDELVTVDVETCVSVNKVTGENGQEDFYALYCITDDLDMCENIMEGEYVYTDSLKIEDLQAELEKLYEKVREPAYREKIMNGVKEKLGLKQQDTMEHINLGEGKEYTGHCYWNDSTSFALDIGDGELTDKDGDAYFIHCEYNTDNDGKDWYYIFQIWFDENVVDISDFEKNIRPEYLTEEMMDKIKDFIQEKVRDEKEVEQEEEIELF